MTMLLPPKSSRATTISIVRFDTNDRPSSVLFSCITINLLDVQGSSAAVAVSAPAPGAETHSRLLARRQEVRFLHQLVVALVVGSHPGLERVAGHEGLVI